MNYSNHTVRRQDRLLPEPAANALLQHCEYGVLSMVSETNTGYGIPLNYVLEEDHIYFHCAPEGEKLCALARNSHVSFCVVGASRVIPDKFTTAYASVIVKGIAITGLADDEKLHALELILDKYSPNDKEVGLKYAAQSFSRTEIIRLDILSVSGKSKVVR